MSESGDDSRKLGVEFGELDEQLESHDYPATSDELTDQYGDHTFELSGGEMTFEEVLDGFEEDQEFESAEEVRQAVFNMVGTEAVGRDRYSDRGQDQDPEEQDSF